MESLLWLSPFVYFWTDSTPWGDEIKRAAVGIEGGYTLRKCLHRETVWAIEKGSALLFEVFGFG
jgi:hypothetical protein